MVRACDQRQFSSAREGEASILWDQHGATAGPDQRERVVAAFCQITSELIDAGARRHLTPSLDPRPRGLPDPGPTRRATIRSHATSSPGPAFLGADSAGASLDAIGDARCLSVEGGGRRGRLHQFVCGRVRRNLEWTDQGPRDGLSLDRLPATARPGFFPCRQAAAFLAGQKSRLPPSSAMLWA